MPKLIYTINTRNKSYNLLEEVHKDFGGNISSQNTCDRGGKLCKGEAKCKSK